MSLTIEPITISAANQYVDRWHRHHARVHGALFATSVRAVGAVEPCGVAIVGRPVARRLQDGRTCEVVRVATDGTRNACSRLYQACRRIAQAMGFTRCITYTLSSESGASLRATGATVTGSVSGREWSTPSRQRRVKGGAQAQDKQRWDLLAALREGTPDAP